MPKRTGGWPAQQQHRRSGGATAAGKCFVMEHLELSREQRQKQRDSAASLCQHNQQQLWCGQALQAAQWWPWLSTLVWGWCHSWSLLVHRHTELSKYVVKPYGDHWLTYALCSAWGTGFGNRICAATFTQVTFLHPFYLPSFVIYTTPFLPLWSCGRYQAICLSCTRYVHHA